MKIFNRIAKKFGKMVIGLFLIIIAAWGISAWDYYYYGEIVSLYVTGIFTAFVGGAIIIDYKKKK